MQKGTGTARVGTVWLLIHTFLRGIWASLPLIYYRRAQGDSRRAGPCLILFRTPWGTWALTMAYVV